MNELMLRRVSGKRPPPAGTLHAANKASTYGLSNPKSVTVEAPESVRPQPRHAFVTRGKRAGRRYERRGAYNLVVGFSSSCCENAGQHSLAKVQNPVAQHINF